MVDVVSLYPTVMLEPNNFYPAGELEEVYARNPNKLGFYKINVTQDDNILNILPFRDFDDKTKPLDWKRKGTFTTYCVSEDLNVLD
jgi:hypothetical protein